MKLYIYTDSSKSLSSNVVGIAFVVVDKSENKIIYEHKEYIKNITNNRGELLAIYKALIYYEVNKQNIKFCKIFSDSLYCVNSLNGIWKIRYHKDLFDKCKDILYNNKHLSIHWIKGHNGDKYNTLADELANEIRIKGERRNG